MTYYAASINTIEIRRQYMGERWIEATKGVSQYVKWTDNSLVLKTAEHYKWKRGILHAQKEPAVNGRIDPTEVKKSCNYLNGQRSRRQIIKRLQAKDTSNIGAIKSNKE